MAEPLNATFFALQRRDRAVLLPATIVYALIVALIVAAFAALNWGTLQNMFALLRNMQVDQSVGEAEAMNMVTGMFGLFGWLFLLLFPFYFATAAYEAACLRWMIRGEAPGLFGLTFDHDMWRVYGIYWVWFLTQLVVNFGFSLLLMPFMFMMMGEVIAQGGADPNSAAMWNMQVKMQALTFLQYIPLAFVGIRFGPAAATSVARQQFSFFEAWNVTRDRFGALLGAYALLWLIFGAAYAVLFAALYGPVFYPFFAEIAAAWPDLPADITQRYFDIVFAPSTWLVFGVGYLISSALLLAYMVLSYGVNARTALAALEEGKISGPAPSP